MFKHAIALMLAMLCLSALQSVALAADARMQVDVLADQQQVEVNWLHANMQKAAALALPQLWNRIIPQSAHGLIPKRLKAIRFLQKATPTDNGVRITFNQKRVMAYLKQHKLPYIAQQPDLNVVLQLYNSAGRPMGQSANALLDDAASLAGPLGYRLDDQGPPLVLLWRWLDDQHVRLNVRGTSKLNEFSETRRLQAGDPQKQLKPWLRELLLQARDAYVEPIDGVDLNAANAAPANLTSAIVTIADPQVDGSQLSAPVLGATAEFIKPVVELHLRVMRQASLAEQILFEHELQRDPRILNLSLRQVNQEGQQYRLQLKGADDQWLVAWFARRGMTLKPTIEGWVAR